MLAIKLDMAPLIYRSDLSNHLMNRLVSNSRWDGCAHLNKKLKVMMV